MANTIIRNIIFDLGGVILDVDYGKTRQAFIDLGVHNFDEFYQQSYSNPLFTQLEKGSIEPSAFYEGLRQATGIQAPDASIQTAWDAMLGYFLPNSISLLESLKSKFRVFLLSNTNAIHHQAFVQIHQLQFGTANFDGHFEKAYYSHTMHERKPEAAAFQTVLHENGLDEKETLFIDDTYKNIEGAKAVGLQTLFLEKGEAVEKALANIILL